MFVLCDRHSSVHILCFPGKCFIYCETIVVYYGKISLQRAFTKPFFMRIQIFEV